MLIRPLRDFENHQTGGFVDICLFGIRVEIKKRTGASGVAIHVGVEIPRKSCANKPKYNRSGSRSHL